MKRVPLIRFIGIRNLYEAKQRNKVTTENIDIAIKKQTNNNILRNTTVKLLLSEAEIEAINVSQMFPNR